MNQNVELLININTAIDPVWVNIDISENIPFPITYKIADIRKPDARNVSFSKTINIPGTKNNNYYLSNIFKIEKQIESTIINYEPDFNPNLKTECVVKQNTLEIFKGILKIEKILISHQNDLTYVVTIYNSLANIFDIWGDKELSDLDFSEYNHIRNYDNVVDSREYQIQKNGSNFPFSFGEGYVYPHIDYGYSTKITEKVVDGVKQIIKTQGGKYYKTVDFFPAIYLFTVLKKMFSSAGFTWNVGGFLDSELIKHLIIPFTNPLEYLKPTAQEQDLRSFLAFVPANYEIDSHPFGIGTDKIVAFDNATTAPAHDNGNVFNDGSGSNTFKVAKTGRYDLLTELNINFKFTFDSLPVGYLVLASSYAIRFYYDILLNGTSIKLGYQLLEDGGLLTSTNEINVNGLNFKLSLTNYLLQKDDEIKIQIKTHGSASIYLLLPPISYITFTADEGISIATTIISGSSFECKYNASQLAEGEEFPMNKVLPKGIKQRDFFMSIIKMFNLFIEADKINEKQLNIETRDNFYSYETRDWTSKIDLNKNYEIIPMGELEGKKYLYSYKPDKDYFNKKYSEKWIEIYGEKGKSINNDFIKDTKKTEIIFSPTPSVQYPSSGNRVYPQIIQLDKDNNIKNTSANIRILYYDGLLFTSPWFIKEEPTQINHIQITYAYCGHVDHPSTPTIDLCFDRPQEIYWTAGNILNNYTDNNLFNKYYSKFINEVTDKNSKILRIWMYLKSSDISELSFKRKYFIDGNYYILNAINDFDVNKTDSVECEFLLLKESGAFIGSVIIIPEGENDQQTYPTLIRGGIDYNKPPQQNSFYDLISGGINSLAGNSVVNVIDGNN